MARGCKPSCHPNFDSRHRFPAWANNAGGVTTTQRPAAERTKQRRALTRQRLAVQAKLHTEHRSLHRVPAPWFGPEEAVLVRQRPGRRQAPHGYPPQNCIASGGFRKLSPTSGTDDGKRRRACPDKVAIMSKVAPQQKSPPPFGGGQSHRGENTLNGNSAPFEAC